MEQRFFDAMSAESQQAAGEAVQKLKRDALARAEAGNGKTREDIKGSYARRLAERLAKVKA